MDIHFDRIKLLKIVILLMSFPAFASNPRLTPPHLGIGASAGYGIASSTIPNENAGSGIAWGMVLGYHFQPRWEIGFSYSSFNTTHSHAPSGSTSSLGLALFRFVFHPNGEFNPLYLGIQTGAGIYSNTPHQPPSYGTSGFAFGGTVGYDHPVGHGLTFGPQLSYIAVSAPAAPDGVLLNSVSAFIGLVQVKYWF